MKISVNTFTGHEAPSAFDGLNRDDFKDEALEQEHDGADTGKR